MKTNIQFELLLKDLKCISVKNFAHISLKWVGEI